MKVMIAGWYHPKNLSSLSLSVERLGWIRVYDINEADVVFNSCEYIDTKLYPDKKFIFGPHFCVIPDSKLLSIGNARNAIYIQPSQQVVDMWINDYSVDKYISLRVYAFGIDTDRFKPSDCAKEDVFIYYKNRDPRELCLVTTLLTQRGIKYNLINYGLYTEDQYIDQLDRSSYGIWLGSHESQGFALEEALSMNVPLLVWSTLLMSQENNCDPAYHSIKSPMTSAPYWHPTCGEIFYDQSQISNSLDIFLSKLYDYNPRQYILDNLSISARTTALKELVDSM
jgi:hypothetical protein